MSAPIRVLVVDDSALVREMLTDMLGSDPGIEVVGSAPDAAVARTKIKLLNPDVITLDIEMPGMDGLTFLERIMRLRPMPVVMVSTLTQEGADSSLRALELGAFDVVAKPTGGSGALAQKRDEVVGKVKAAAAARVRALNDLGSRPARLPPRAAEGRGVVAIGASTGGVEALNEVICALPAGMPPILIVQHMPPGFTASFAARLNRRAALTVVEASDGLAVQPGHVYLAPGDRHLELAREGGGLVCRLTDAPLVNGHRPSADVLFQSVADIMGKDAVGVILTGMGKDGAQGLRAMRDAGARTIGQDAATCVVYGMPGQAAALGAVETEAPLGRIADLIVGSLEPAAS